MSPDLSDTPLVCKASKPKKPITNADDIIAAAEDRVDTRDGIIANLRLAALDEGRPTSIRIYADGRGWSVLETAGDGGSWLADRVPYKQAVATAVLWIIDHIERRGARPDIQVDLAGGSR